MVPVLMCDECLHDIGIGILIYYTNLVVVAVFVKEFDQGCITSEVLKKGAGDVTGTWFLST